MELLNGMRLHFNCGANVGNLVSKLVVVILGILTPMGAMMV